MSSTARAILVLGANSPMARAAAAVYAARGDKLYLAGNEGDEVERVADDLRVRYQAEVHHGPFDADRFAEHPAVLAAVVAALGGLDGVVCAVGYMGNQEKARHDVGEIVATFARNLTGVATMLALCADHLEAQRRGFLTVIASVAGDRGRQSNYTYGAAKGGLTRFLEGLRNRLAPAGVRVVTVKPGFVDTEMTFGLPGLFLVASPEAVGRALAQAPERRADTVYVPGFWRLIMLIIRHVPEVIFKRMKM